MIVNLWMSILAKKQKHPEKRKKTTTYRKINIKMSTRGAQFLHLACQGGGLPLCQLRH